MVFRSSFVVLLLFMVWPVLGQETSGICNSADHGAFDFWVGEWDVYDRQNVKVGKNSIQKEEGGCVVVENYQSVKNSFTGRSINFFNPDTGNWEQLWIDNQGSYLHLYGRLQEGVMVLQGDHGKGDNRRTDKISWTLLDDGRVKQLWEQKKQNEGWVTVFEGFYVRNNEHKP